MIPRYENSDLAKVWSLEGYRDRLIEASIISLQVDPQVDPDKAESCLRDHRGKLTVEAWAELEAEYDHDIAAWVELVRRILPEDLALRWHRLRTSSDLADTALAIGLLHSEWILNLEYQKLAAAVADLAIAHRHTPILGRTHGQFAEWTSVGRRFAVLLDTMDSIRLPAAPTFVKMSGPVGTMGSDSWRFFNRSLLTEVPSTQIVPRAYLARYASGLAAFSVCLTDLAMTVRLGARETQEGANGARVPEWCREGRKGTSRGSSAMPQKSNPIRSEKVTGLTKLIRTNCYAVIEASAGLWEERDISHSSVERVALVDALHLTAHCMSEMTRVMTDLVVEDRVIFQDVSTPTGVGAVEALIKVGYSPRGAYDQVKMLGPTCLKGSESRDFAGKFNVAGIKGPDTRVEREMWELVRRYATATTEKTE